MPNSSSGKGALPKYAHGQLRGRSSPSHEASRGQNEIANKPASPASTPDVIAALKQSRLGCNDADTHSDGDSCNSTEEFIRGQVLQYIQRAPARNKPPCQDTTARKDTPHKSSRKTTPSKADVLAQEALDSVRRHLHSKHEAVQAPTLSPVLGHISNSPPAAQCAGSHGYEPSSSKHASRNQPPGSSRNAEGQQAASGDGSCNSIEREVAAIIIQTYWRRWCAWKLQVRKAAESTMLQRLANGALDDDGVPLHPQRAVINTSRPPAASDMDATFIEEATRILLGLDLQAPNAPAKLASAPNAETCTAAAPGNQDGMTPRSFQASPSGPFLPANHEHIEHHPRSTRYSTATSSDGCGESSPTAQSPVFDEDTAAFGAGAQHHPGARGLPESDPHHQSLSRQQLDKQRARSAQQSSTAQRDLHQRNLSTHSIRELGSRSAASYPANKQRRPQEWSPDNEPTAPPGSAAAGTNAEVDLTYKQAAAQQEPLHPARQSCGQGVSGAVRASRSQHDTLRPTQRREANGNSSTSSFSAVLHANTNESPAHTVTTVGLDTSEAVAAPEQAASALRSSQQWVQASRSLGLSTDKLKSILDYLDTADQQADAEAMSLQSSEVVGAHLHQQPPLPLARQAPMSTAGSMAAPSSLHHHPGAELPDNVSVCCSLESASALSAGNKSALLAETVFTTFKSRLQKLQDEVRQREAAIVGMHREMESMRQQHEAQLEAGESRLAYALDQQRQEYEANIARHLGFIDRLLADKDELSKNCSNLMEQVQALQKKQENAVVSMQDGWAVELKRHKEAWAAAEKIKREQWAEVRTAEIKEITIKGLEHEVHNILAKQKAEILHLQEQAAESTRKHLDAQSLQHEAATRQLKERLLREQEDALDRERVASQNRLREASERYEQQLQSQRMRLIADQDLRMDQLEAQHREERRRLEEAAARAARDSELHEKQLLEDAAREKEALRRAHEKQQEELRQQIDTQQQGWKDAVLERSRRELAQREAKLRQALHCEQQEELRVVLERLEGETEQEHGRLEAEYRDKEQSLAAKHNAALKEAKKSEARFAEKFRQAAETGRAAEDRAAAAEQHLAEMRKELGAKNERLRWFEDQVSKAEDKERQHADSIRATAALKEDAYKDRLEDAHVQMRKLSAALERAMKENEEVKHRRERDMEYLDRRVKVTLAKKEERIQELQDKVAALETDSKQTTAMLSQIHQELPR